MKEIKKEKKNTDQTLIKMIKFNLILKKKTNISSTNRLKLEEMITKKKCRDELIRMMGSKGNNNNNNNNNNKTSLITKNDMILPTSPLLSHYLIYELHACIRVCT